MLRLHKGNSIPSTAGVTKKLIQQYVDPFLILEKVGCLAYKLAISNAWRIYLVFSVAQLELAPFSYLNLFFRPHPSYLHLVFIENDTNVLKSFEVKRLLNKKVVKKSKGHLVEYLVC